MEMLGFLPQFLSEQPLALWALRGRWGSRDKQQLPDPEMKVPVNKSSGFSTFLIVAKQAASAMGHFRGVILRAVPEGPVGSPCLQPFQQFCK